MTPTESKNAIKTIYDALTDKKALDITVLDIHNVSTLADYFVIASGSNPNQIQAMVDNVSEELSKLGIHSSKIEGVRNSSWILMDYKDIVVHIFSEEDRRFYDLERIWRDAAVVEME